MFVKDVLKILVTYNVFLYYSNNFIFIIDTCFKDKLILKNGKI